MLKGLQLIGFGIMWYCAPFLAWMLLAAVMKAPLAFGLLALLIVAYGVVSALLLLRTATPGTSRRSPAETGRGPMTPDAWQRWQPVQVTHWHQAVGPGVRRPAWAPLAAAQAARARAARPGSRTDPAA